MAVVSRLMKQTGPDRVAFVLDWSHLCLLYTSDAADERSSVDLGGRRIIKKKKKHEICGRTCRESRNKEQRYVRIAVGNTQK